MFGRLGVKALKHRLDSLSLASDSQTNQSLSVLRSDTRDGALSNLVRLAPGIELHADPTMGVSGHYRSPPGQILEVEAEAAQPGDWFGLHIKLFQADLTDRAVVGFVARVQAPEVLMMRAALRSATQDGGFQDTLFDKHILLHPEEATHLDAISLPMTPAVPVTADWRELVLFLPPKTMRLSLIDLRVFIV